MASLNAYIKHAQRGPDMVLETAASDPEISDADYEKLWSEITKNVKRGRRGGLGQYAKLRDREAARAESMV